MLQYATNDPSMKNMGELAQVEGELIIGGTQAIQGEFLFITGTNVRTIIFFFHKKFCTLKGSNPGNWHFYLLELLVYF